MVFEGVPTYPDAGRFWQMIEKHKVTIFYTAPTAIRSLIKAAEGDEKVHPKRYDLSSLRILGSVGEPINPEAWMWYHKHVGGERCPIVDTFWQTETGGHMITPLPGATPLVPGSCTLPLPGIMAAIVDETGKDVPNGRGRHAGHQAALAVDDPHHLGRPGALQEELLPGGDGRQATTWPATARCATRRPATSASPAASTTCSTCRATAWARWRSNRRWCRKTDLVAEAAVVGRPDDMTGEAICAFVVLKRSRPTGDEAKQIANELRNWVAKEIGPIAKPKDIRFGDNLPKTRSGKIMRRLLRSHRQGRGDHAGHQHAGEPGHPGAAGQGPLIGAARRAIRPA